MTASLHPQFSQDGRFRFWVARDATAPPADALFPWDGGYMSIAQMDLTANPAGAGLRRDYFRTTPASARGFLESHALVERTMWFSRTASPSKVVDEGCCADVNAASAADAAAPRALAPGKNTPCHPPLLAHHRWPLP